MCNRESFCYKDVSFVEMKVFDFIYCCLSKKGSIVKL